MLLPDMTHEEIRTDLLRDLEEVIQQIHRNVPQLKIRMTQLQLRSKRVILLKKITSRNKIEWIIKLKYVPSSPSHFEISYGAFYHNTKGIRFVSIHPISQKLSIYNSHFFRRYNERRKLNLKDNIREIFKTFVTRNDNYGVAATSLSSTKGEHGIVTQIADGYQFGNAYPADNTEVWNTFLTCKGKRGSYILKPKKGKRIRKVTQFYLPLPVVQLDENHKEWIDREYAKDLEYRTNSRKLKLAEQSIKVASKKRKKKKRRKKKKESLLLGN